METYFDITPDLCASLLENGTWLEIESESLDKRDCYAFKPDPGAEGEFNWEYTEWALSDKLGGLTEAELAVRGLPNYSEEGSGDWSGWLWEKNPAFVAWANAALDKATAAALAAAEKDDEEDDADAIFESRNPQNMNTTPKNSPAKGHGGRPKGPEKVTLPVRVLPATNAWHKAPARGTKSPNSALFNFTVVRLSDGCEKFFDRKPRIKKSADFLVWDNKNNRPS